MMTTEFRLRSLVRSLALGLAVCGGASFSLAAEYQWDFGGDLSGSFGGGAMTYADATTPGLTSFGTTDGSTVPHINGQPASYMHVPQFTLLGQAYDVEFPSTGPNGGGAYVNQYTMIFDLLWPNSPDWSSFFNTNQANPSGNDGDFYLASDGSLGIGELGYTAVGVIASDEWHRIAFVADLGAGIVTFYVDGTQEYQRTGSSLVDGRFSLTSNLDAGPDLRLFNEGDTSGNYTQELYINSYYFADRALSPGEIAALGGPDANGIVPEPSCVLLLVMGLASFLAIKR